MNYRELYPFFYKATAETLTPIYVPRPDGTFEFPRGYVAGLIALNRTCDYWRPQYREALRKERLLRKC